MAYDLVDLGKELTSYVQSFCLSPSQWQLYGRADGLQWTTIQFTEANRQLVPQSAGLYAFSISPAVSDIFEHHYLMYIGQAGFNSANTLYKRYQDYITPSKVARRPKILRMKELWPDNICYSYTVVDVATTNLKDIETELNDALIPPCVTGDFSTEIRRAKKAFLP